MTREASEYVGGFRHQTLLHAPTDSDGQNSQHGNLTNTVLWSNRGFRTLSAQMILMENTGLWCWFFYVPAFLRDVLNVYCSFVSL